MALRRMNATEFLDCAGVDEIEVLRIIVAILLVIIVALVWMRLRPVRVVRSVRDRGQQTEMQVRFVLTQSQTTYRRDLVSPRFQPLSSRDQGAWE